MPKTGKDGENSAHIKEKDQTKVEIKQFDDKGIEIKINEPPIEMEFRDDKTKEFMVEKEKTMEKFQELHDQPTDLLITQSYAKQSHVDTSRKTKISTEV